MAITSEAWLDDTRSALDRGDLITAARLLEAHNAARSTDPDVLRIHARMLGMRARHAEAIAALERAIEHHPHLLGSLAIERAQYALRLRDTAGADQWFARAWAAGARDDGLLAWVDVLGALNRLPAAIGMLEALCREAPGNGERWFWLGYAHQRLDHYAQARDAYERGLALTPERPMLRSNLAALAVQERDFERARPVLEQVVRLEPDNGFAWANYASTLHAQGELDDALVAAERALAIRADIASAWLTYSNICRDFNRWDVARHAADQAALLEPADPRYRWATAMLQLAQGDYASGWIAHESRWHGSNEMRHIDIPPAPRWDGQPLRGKTVLIWGEQGFGDVMQFVRFVPAFARYVRDQGGEFSYECFDPLYTLFVRSFPGLADRIRPAASSHRPVYDYQLPVGSLPQVLGVTLPDLARWPAPYLFADPQRVAARRERFAQQGRRVRVGLVWTGSQTHQRNPFRSVPPQALAQALAGIANAEFFCLQQGAEADVAVMRAAGLALTDESAGWQSFDDTAAHVASLDLVITVCTSMAHLAGALGVPTWLMLDINPHWVWMWDRHDSPWYASVKLYRQVAYRQWASVLAQVASDLADHVLASQKEFDRLI